MDLRPLLPLTLMLLFACGGVEPSELAGDPASASAEAVELAALGGAALVPMTPCPTSGEGALLAPATCVVFTPAEAGSGPDGENADSLQYALEPAGAARGQLLVYLNASGSSPGRQIADPTLNFYDAGASGGLHVLALAYRSDAVLGLVCGDDGACYGAARAAVLTGAAAPGTPARLADIVEDEGVLFRLDAALRLLAARRPGRGWGRFLANSGAATPAERIAWPRLLVAGHSQGGGHAAFLGTRYPVHRVIQLASTCDAALGAPAPWTHSDGTWATDPAARYFGLAVARDAICSAHAAVWQVMGMDPARQDDAAAACSGGAHGGPIFCTENYPRWVQLLQ
ncbi:MAG: hypothetical protein H6730_08660 [Deltaproteobacteria bacterium]|nr:hypothetical protein [Deltaproteobacteria bacterium]